MDGWRLVCWVRYDRAQVIGYEMDRYDGGAERVHDMLHA